MVIKRYSFPNEQTAKDLIELLDLQGGTMSNEIGGIVELGFQDEYTYNVETQESILSKKGLTYNVDVIWLIEPKETWVIYEVEPLTPNHNFA